MKKTLLSTLYFQNAAEQLLEDSAGFLRANWNNSPRQSEEVRALFTHMIYALQRRNWSRIIINQVGMRPFSREEQHWVAQEWLPMAVQAGYGHGAIVGSRDVMVRLATAYITTHMQSLPLIYQSFETEAEALEWLLRQPHSPQLQRKLS
ncbi:hypothetical protein [uncultured Hymenobacter sp.]|uniref:hypothetical protein n=1 Tax=uncultured Hymenobacter sp. TaxID=170016 RepID=UPI0035CB7B58